MLRTLLILGRVSNLPTVWTNVLAGWFLAGGDWSLEIVWLAAGISLLYVAGMTLNDAFDASWDREHAPERPIPSGAIAERTVWTVGFAQTIAGMAVLLVFTRVAWPWVAGLVAAILLYDWLHKKTAAAIVVMGACRALVYLAAASALAKTIPTPVWWWSGGMLIYVAGITLAAKGERTGGALPWVARVVLAAPLIAIFSKSIATGLFASFMWMSFVFSPSFRMKTGEISMGRFVGGLIAQIALLDGLIVEDLSVVALVVCIGSLVLAFLLQRKIPAT